ncbi:uncharacterized protein LOC134245720 isoform X1 [Saccostrea cucullata]|uniref:uncharacterized protein LOC134245720 isoform X1 n=1 Tax=Saccostrea cuccullata TaxID=36930 RepID=UPI002ED2299F
MIMYVKVFTVWIVSTNFLQCLILDRYLRKEDLILYMNSIGCRLDEVVERYKKVSNRGHQCRLVVDYERQRLDGYHAWRMIFDLQAEETVSSISKNLKKCRQTDDEKVFTMSCNIYNNSSLGDICLSNKNCVNNTVCSNRFNGRYTCTCKEGYQEENGECIKENLSLGENCSLSGQCNQSNAECRNSVCS